MTAIISGVIFIAAFTGLYLLISGLFPRTDSKVIRAVQARAVKKETASAAVINGAAVKLLPFISLEDAKRQNVERSLRTLGMDGTPELFVAKAWGGALTYFLLTMAAIPFLHFAQALLLPGIISAGSVYLFGLLLAGILAFIAYRGATAGLMKRILERRKAIEWELPQFSGTVLQCLGHTRNVIDILRSYQKICGPALKDEIAQTLNDMQTGNHENALKNLASRVNSGAFTQLVNGLIGLLRGDDQRNYFQIITNDFTKSQQELIKKEYLARPAKLTINNMLLLFGMTLMLFVAIGSHLMDAGAELF